MQNYLTQLKNKLEMQELRPFHQNQQFLKKNNIIWINRPYVIKYVINSIENDDFLTKSDRVP